MAAGRRLFGTVTALGRATDRVVVDSVEARPLANSTGHAENPVGTIAEELTAPGLLRPV